MKTLCTITLACAFICVTNPIAAEQKKSDNGIVLSVKETDGRSFAGDILCYLVTNADDAGPLKTYTDELAKQVIPEESVCQVRYFNKFGEYIFGRDATIAIPWLNYIVVNKDSFGELSQEARRFVLGRCLFALKQKHGLFLRGYLLSALTLGYTARSLDSSLDLLAAKELNAVAGAIEYFEKYKQFKHDGTYLGELSTYIPFGYLIRLFLAQHLIPLLLYNKEERAYIDARMTPELFRGEEESNLLASSSLKLKEGLRSKRWLQLLHILLFWPLSPLSRTVGSPVHDASRITHFLSGIPPVRYVMSTVATDKRLQALRELQTELNKTKQS